MATKLSEEIPQEVEVMERMMWLILRKEVVALVVAMVEGVPETDELFRAAEEICDHAGADGPDVDPEYVESCKAVLSPDLAVLTEDGEEPSSKRLEVWLEDTNEEYATYPAETRLVNEDSEETEDDRLEVECL